MEAWVCREGKEFYQSYKEGKPDDQVKEI